MRGIKSIDNNIVVGHLGGHGFYSYGGRGGTTSPYQYGWPAGGSSESNVSAQWIFDEASGDITDEVASVVLTDQVGNTYQVDSSAYSADMALSISFGTGGGFGKLTRTTEMEPGTNDFTQEWVMRRDGAITGNDDISDTGRTNVDGWQMFFTGSVATSLRWILYVGSVNIWDVTFTVTDTGTTNFAKWRLPTDRDGNAEPFIDGSSQGAVEVSGGDGQNIISTNMGIGNDGGGGLSLNATFNEYRFSENLTNNSGGPGGG